jgi:DNA primase
VEGRAKAAEAALFVVAEHPSDLVRDQYVMNVAGRCRIDADRLRSRLHEVRRERPRVRAGSAPRADRRRSQATVTRDARPVVNGDAGRGAPVDDNARSGPSSRGDDERRTGNASQMLDQSGPGVEALRLAVHRPEDVADRLEAILFFDPVQRAAFEALASSGTLHEAIERAEPAAAALLERMAVEDTEADADEVVTRVVELAALRALADLESQARVSDARFAELAPLTRWLRLKIEELREPVTGVETVSGLLPWLVESAQEDA